MKSLQTKSCVRKSKRPTRLLLQSFEDRCTPASYSYAPESQTLTVIAADQDEITVKGNVADPIGYVTVQVQQGMTTTTAFNSAVDAQPVRNLVVHFDGVDTGKLYLLSDLHLSGKLGVFAARDGQYFSSKATVSGNLSYTSSG